jgi:hypothetical protein
VFRAYGGWKVSLYSSTFREEVFSETGLPIDPVLGNSEAQGYKKSRGLTTPALVSVGNAALSVAYPTEKLHSL